MACPNLYAVEIPKGATANEINTHLRRNNALQGALHPCTAAQELLSTSSCTPHNRQKAQSHLAVICHNTQVALDLISRHASLEFLRVRVGVIHHLIVRRPAGMILQNSCEVGIAHRPRHFFANIWAAACTLGFWLRWHSRIARNPVLWATWIIQSLQYRSPVAEVLHAYT